MEYKYFLNKSNEILIKFIQLYLIGNNLDEILDTLLKLFQIMDFNYQSFLRQVFSLPFIPSIVSTKEQIKDLITDLLFKNTKITSNESFLQSFTEKIISEKNIFVNSKLLLYLYVYSNKVKSEILYILNFENYLTEMIKLNYLNHKKEFSKLILDIIFIKEDNMMIPEIHTLIEYLLSNMYLLTNLFEHFSKDEDYISLNLLYGRVFYYFFKKSNSQGLIKKVLDSETLNDINKSMKKSKQSFNIEQKIKDSFKIYYLDPEIEERIIKKHFHPKYSFFNEYLEVSSIRYDNLKFYDFKEKDLQFIYNFIINHNYIFNNLEIDSKYNIDCIIKFIQKEKEIDFNIIVFFFKENNNILSFVYKYDSYKQFNLDYEVINLIYTLNLFQYFENNLEKTPELYRKENRFILVDILISDVIQITLNYKLDPIDFIYYSQFIINVLRSKEYFERNHTKVIQLLHLQFDNAFQQRLKDPLKLAILFHNFISIYIITCKSINEAPRIDLVQRFIYEQSFPYFEKLVSIDTNRKHIKNYLNSFLNIFVNIVELNTLKCFNLKCVRCMDKKIDENYLQFQDNNVFVCKGCSCSNLYEYIEGVIFDENIYLEFILQDLNMVNNLFNAIPYIINKRRKIQYIYYKKVAEFLKHVCIYIYSYNVPKSVIDIYNNLQKEVENYVLNLDTKTKTNKDFLSFPMIIKIQKKEIS